MSEGTFVFPRRVRPSRRTMFFPVVVIVREWCVLKDAPYLIDETSGVHPRFAKADRLSGEVIGAAIEVHRVMKLRSPKGFQGSSSPAQTNSEQKRTKETKQPVLFRVRQPKDLLLFPRGRIVAELVSRPLDFPASAWPRGGEFLRSTLTYVCEICPRIKDFSMDSMSSGPHGSSMRCMEIRGGSRAVEDAFDTPGLDGFLYSRPFEGAERGGDLHYVSVCGGGVITRVVVADVSGHGARVATFSEALRSLMRKNINTKSQTRLVEALNRQFGEHARLLRFATAVVATYLATDRTLTVCNAGHPRPLCYRKRLDRWMILDGSGTRRETCRWASTTIHPITSSPRRSSRAISFVSTPTPLPRRWIRRDGCLARTASWTWRGG